jgi:two-component system phosphate regulon sensor histidine kinase PhoR
MQLTFRTKLLASHVALVAAVVLLVILELNRALGADLERQLDQRLEQQALGAAQWVGEGRRHPDKLAGRLALVVNADATIFDRDGNVIGDAAKAGAPPEEVTGGPPGPEVNAAHQGGVGHATRARLSTGEVMHYVAVPAADGMVLRLGAPLSEISATIAAMRRRLLFASALAIAAALGLGFLAARVAAEPLRAMTASATRIAKGDYEIGLPSTSPDEFGVLSQSLASLATQLKARIGDLTAERDRLTAILAGMVEGVLVFDPQGKVLMANPAAAEIVGGSAPLEGRALASSVPDPAIRAFIEETMKSGHLAETEIETEGGGGRSIAMYVRPLTTRGAGGVVTVLRDMTRLRRLMTVRRDFVANVSHELRTPVTAIQGYAETLLRGRLDEATSRQFLEIVHRQALRIGALVQGLLALSELEARQSNPAIREAVDVSAVAANVVQTMRERAAASGSSIRVEVSEGAVALGDPGGIEQVIENLVDNALKYGRQGGVIRIDGGREAERVVFRVQDDGPGIEGRHLPRLFERFYRVDSGRSRERGGTGLGLAIVKHLVESMGGKVRVTSDVEKGSCFTVELPAIS